MTRSAPVSGEMDRSRTGSAARGVSRARLSQATAVQTPTGRLLWRSASHIEGGWKRSSMWSRRDDGSASSGYRLTSSFWVRDQLAAVAEIAARSILIFSSGATAQSVVLQHHSPAGFVRRSLLIQLSRALASLPRASAILALPRGAFGASASSHGRSPKRVAAKARQQPLVVSSAGGIPAAAQPRLDARTASCAILQSAVTRDEAAFIQTGPDAPVMTDEI